MIKHALKHTACVNPPQNKSGHALHSCVECSGAAYAEGNCTCEALDQAENLLSRAQYCYVDPVAARVEATARSSAGCDEARYMSEAQCQSQLEPFKVTALQLQNLM